jgi:hypothetical protein
MGSLDPMTITALIFLGIVGIAGVAIAVVRFRRLLRRNQIVKHIRGRGEWNPRWDQNQP